MWYSTSIDLHVRILEFSVSRWCLSFHAPVLPFGSTWKSLGPWGESKGRTVVSLLLLGKWNSEKLYHLDITQMSSICHPCINPYSLWAQKGLRLQSRLGFGLCLQGGFSILRKAVRNRIKPSGCVTIIVTIK